MLWKDKLKDKENIIRDNLKNIGVSSAHIDVAMKTLNDGIDNITIPRIAFIGFTGVGKSTTLNALFNAGQQTSDVRACTQKETPIIGDVSKYTGSKGSIIVYDMPGLGEDLKSDEEHFKTYKRVLPIVDVAIWTFHTGDRAMTPMQNALTRLNSELGNEFQKKLMFAINKADAIAPGETAWNSRTNGPSREQSQNIKELECYIKEKIQQVIPRWNGELVTYSAKKRYRLELLMSAMVNTMPSERKWVLDDIADVADPRELMDAKVKEFIEDKRRCEWKK